MGTETNGNTFPGADVPFGMVQWSPDTPTRLTTGGYDYDDTSIIGYSLTHFSGTGGPVAGDVPILPVAGTVRSRDVGLGGEQVVPDGLGRLQEPFVVGLDSNIDDARL